VDPTLGHLEQLEPYTQRAAYWLVWAAREAGLPLIITSSRRSAAEQAALVASGRSKTLQSRHLTGQAFDVDIYRMNRDSVPMWVWEAIGPYAESNLGLVWGGRWKSFRDLGHFEAPT